MASLAVIATLYGQRSADRLPDLLAALYGQTRQPDEIWWMTEAVPDFPVVPLRVELATPRNSDGTYAEIPYSRKINYALDHTEADYVTYLTDDSWPEPAKYERMVAALDEHPEWGAVYCSQDYGNGIRHADKVQPDAYCQVDHTQVMHRRTADRWPLEIGDIMVGDAVFWRRLHASLGPFYPIPEVLDNVRQTLDGISAGQRQ